MRITGPYLEAVFGGSPEAVEVPPLLTMSVAVVPL